MTATLKQDGWPEEGAVFGKDEFEAQLGTAIATLAEMKTMMADVMGRGQGLRCMMPRLRLRPTWWRRVGESAAYGGIEGGKCGEPC